MSDYPHVPAHLAVPPGRLAVHVDGSWVRAWTVQRLGVLDSLVDTGRCLPSLGNSVYAQDFRPAYEWMGRQLATRTGQGAPALFWTWVRTPRVELVRMVTEEAAAARTGGWVEVLLTLRLPTERVLLSGFSAWHCPLNLWPCYTPDQEKAMAAAWDGPDAFVHPIEAAQMARGLPGYSWDDATEGERDAVRATWDLCLRDPYLPLPRGERVQGAAPFLSLDDVEDAVILT